MILHRNGREYYALDITTTPSTVPTDWQASFDGGSTWVAALNVSGHPAWLLAGASADIGTSVAVLSGRVRPQVRLIAAPEIVVRDAPLIHYT
jgi:hypothetical protein